MAVDEKFRVLIVDDIAETRENVRKLLQFETDIEVVGAARSGREAIQLSEELEPDVVLMDINMPDMDGIAATEAIRRKRPFIQVVILSVQGDQNYMRRAMLAGARDFLTKPPMGDDLISAIRRAGEMAHQERVKSVQPGAPAAVSGGMPAALGISPAMRGKVITVYSPKGGVGATTVAVNLALVLHNEETKAVVVDGNLQYGDVAIFINEQGKNTILDLAPRVDELDAEIVSEVMVKHSQSGLHVLAAPSRPEQAENINGNQFQKIIEYLRGLYAYVIVDTVSVLDDITLAALDSSDIILLLVSQDIPAIKNVRLFLDLIASLGIEKKHIVFAMNHYDKRIGITPEKVGENLKVDVVAAIPLDYKTVIPAVNRGVPFVLDGKSRPASKGIFILAEKVRERLALLEEEELGAQV